MINGYFELAAIITSDVASGKKPMLFALRDTPVSFEDSGWQFWGETDLTNKEKAQVWMLREVLEFEPSLVRYINSPIGTCLSRGHAGDPWTVLQQDPLQ